ncbi:interleukin-9-like [Xenopus laevis]|uniref:Interleukin-9-like n=1 Tax=Xenopus laevis TaxID=8355 RepID=A0A8J1MJ01_XENLA|nr:interleukin-9-like [Xenopus laevis]
MLGGLVIKTTQVLCYGYVVLSCIYFFFLFILTRSLISVIYFQDQEKHKGCGCLDIPQDTCNLSCFNSGLQEIKKHQLGDPNLLSRFSIMRTGCKVRIFVLDLSCAKSCKKTTFGNWYSFLEELRRAFHEIATEAAPTAISTNIY